MKVIYDPVVDVLRILLSEVPIEESDEQSEGVILDFDVAGKVVGIEILDASKRTDNPFSLEFLIDQPVAV
ncbi:DUF2283 domain-containing protein [Pseudanabaena sp. FACHB-1277]|jgi:uncharacterized protein YuzE|uniref:DUF2283 domain-containing protein n=1 Tax=Pseudanabaena cinerea FACHB-1277 TaxID=2949581 RepID=A0A926UUX6_9CYAN|nr:DUF2283 domain-containing protein [Pseudanabaena cinerea]MBD2150432.1 DUF2283 domain-containing protein [Pseudanabaena cinerea FACHB-1277]